jgi:cell division protein FtsB
MTSRPYAQRYLFHTAIAAVMIGLLVYLTAGLIGGDRGLTAKAHLKVEIANLQQQLATLNDRRSYLDTRVKALDPDHPDLDMLGEEARQVLFYSAPNEVILTPAVKTSH